MRSLKTKESREFWASVDKTAKEVASWPAWKRGEIEVAQNEAYVTRKLRPKASEHDHQSALFQWARHPATLRQYPDLKHYHAIPNGAKVPYRTMYRNGKPIQVSRERTKLMEEGLLAGVSDTFLPVARGRYHGLYLELKALDNEPTDKQYLWLRDMLTQGYYTDWCNDWEIAKGVIEWYLSLPPLRLVIL